MRPGGKTIARACGYSSAASVSLPEELEEALAGMKAAEGPCFLEVKCALGARSDLGRPTTTPQENKRALMTYLREVRPLPICSPPILLRAIAPMEWLLERTNFEIAFEQAIVSYPKSYRFLTCFPGRVQTQTMFFCGPLCFFRWILHTVEQNLMRRRTV